jgi:hypothetical protein
MASGEEQSAHSIYSKNASPFSEGCETDIWSSTGIGLIAEFSFGYTILFLFFAQKPVKQTQQKYQSST